MEKLGPSALLFVKLSNLTYGALNFPSRMGSINSFCKAVQEILLNNYLKTTRKLEILSPLFGIFFRQYKGKIFLPKKSLLFRILNANILGTAYDRKINELITFLNPLIKSFQVKVVRSFNIKFLKWLGIPNLMKK